MSSLVGSGSIFWGFPYETWRNVPLERKAWGDGMSMRMDRETRWSRRGWWYATADSRDCLCWAVGWPGGAMSVLLTTGGK